MSISDAAGPIDAACPFDAACTSLTLHVGLVYAACRLPFPIDATAPKTCSVKRVCRPHSRCDIFVISDGDFVISHSVLCYSFIRVRLAVLGLDMFPNVLVRNC